mmetsp:Transcript_20055/g.36058  ORF Transcript_20055/g.36058 Transcript_20055/m.36058 type:complete len:144 (-) Transcript_20055:343-774(-)|eukprot:CAMPEP_0175082914 /NCGR_PEP_ID=MMETSP0052_2-20121109/27032_1 /TAXON_ID=51329 ORGANISM="Polytomella parva, Strain SAG 63-3" /NCGR_SAMPLE_ID=MMETSP0052_2 /ASSEMBLY_ACC=CAM_ASM_000194 /LENGTH=143 /DNA_ID=CAMNT_0016354187 /DNA_START=239 /DNA_END=670 /DNA_ORIENTATION=+
MESTLVAIGGKGTNPKTTLYVGGLDECVTESILNSAFISFGDIKDVSIPLDHATGKHRGFGFVEFELKEDAADAIDNMHNAELYGKVLKVNYAQPIKIKGGDKGWSHQPVWADADKYFEELDKEGEEDGGDAKQNDIADMAEV